MEPFSTALLASTLFKIVEKLAEKGIIDPALEKGLEGVRSRLTSAYDAKKADEELRKAFMAAIQKAGGPVEDGDRLAAWLKGCGLDRLQAEKNEALRKRVARALISFTEGAAQPPEDLMTALAWPRSRTSELSSLLTNLRAELAGTAWGPLLDYANEARKLKALDAILEKAVRLESALVDLPEGEALRVVLARRGLTKEDCTQIEDKYRQKILIDYENLETHGLSPDLLTSKPDVNPALKSLPLESVYLEPGLIPMRSEREREAEWEEMLQADETKRLMSELRQQEKRVSDVLASSERLVMVGKPGGGKTVSLKFIALMLAHGQVGASRLQLECPYIPIYIRLAQYAEKLKADSGLGLEKFLMDSVGSYHSPGELGFNEFLQYALDNGLCMLLLDGLDEVGDVGDTLIKGKTLRNLVLAEVQRLARQRCNAACANRVIVTSRIEGYRRGDLKEFDEMELSALAIPEEVKEFLLRWFAAHELKNNPRLPIEELYRKANASVDPLMADIMRSASVQRLAINPLLLTILAMIHKLGTRLPNERVRLYEIVTKTMVESWRQAQTHQDISIYEVLRASRITPMMASLAFWVHEHKPGGAMPEADWRRQIKKLLQEKDDELKDEEADEVAERFMRHAREEAGLLTERSPGQVGFFHLTLEEYLAGVEIAGRGETDRRGIVRKHWHNPRWREVILLAAGQMMLNHSQELDHFVIDLRHMDEEGNPEWLGLPALLSGYAIADVASDHFSKKVVRETRKELVELAQDARLPPTRRAECADLADELDYLPEGIYDFVPVGSSIRDAGPATAPRSARGSAQGGEAEFYIARYPVTNLQYGRFLKKENFEKRELWRGSPKYSEPDKNGECQLLGDWGEVGWNWLQETLKREDEPAKEGVLYPRYWRDPRFGIARATAPVVGISWHEANAYCKWLAANWEGLEEGQQGLEKPGEIRLPTEPEWERAAGGLEPKGRFAWDKAGKVTPDSQVPQFANTYESGINRSTPVWTYPQGGSPQGVMDMSGNVWEWQASYYSDTRQTLGLRGGSWSRSRYLARVSARGSYHPADQWSNYGFRVVVVFPPN